jgi:3-phenylpropionate/trans-cinnamate dioxygenase ferredoxin subunit
MSFNYTDLDAKNLEFIIVAEQGEIPNGERIFVEINDHSIVIFNIAGKFFAIADVCSHDDGPLGDGENESGYEVVCPRHGARFDIRSGKALTLPAIVDIPAYPVRIKGDKVEVGIPKDS